MVGFVGSVYIGYFYSFVGAVLSVFVILVLSKGRGSVGLLLSGVSVTGSREVLGGQESPKRLTYKLDLEK